MNKLVSIIIPYNIDRGYLDRAIKSAEKQTYENIEIIDAYGPGTLGENFNKGLNKSKGDYIKILAEDDFLPANSIHDLVANIGDFDFITGNAYSFVKKDMTPISKWMGKIVTLKEMLKRNCIHGGTPLYRRDGFDRFGKFDPELETGEEYDFHLKWLYKGAKQTNINTIVHYYNIWSGSKSQGLYKNESRLKYIESIKNRYR